MSCPVLLYLFNTKADETGVRSHTRRILDPYNKDFRNLIIRKAIKGMSFVCHNSQPPKDNGSDFQIHNTEIKSKENRPRTTNKRIKI